MVSAETPETGLKRDGPHFIEEQEKKEMEMHSITYLYLTVKTVSEATLLPTIFAPVSKLDQTVEKPGLGSNGNNKNR